MSEWNWETILDAATPFLRSVAPLCETCGGKGTVTGGNLQQAAGTFECPTCHGSGFACSPDEVAERVLNLVRGLNSYDAKAHGLRHLNPDHVRGSG